LWRDNFVSHYWRYFCGGFPPARRASAHTSAHASVRRLFEYLISFCSFIAKFSFFASHLVFGLVVINEPCSVARILLCTIIQSLSHSPTTDDHRVEANGNMGVAESCLTEVHRSYNSVYFLSRGCQNLIWISDLNYRNQRREKKKKFHVHWRWCFLETYPCRTDGGDALNFPAWIEENCREPILLYFVNLTAWSTRIHGPRGAVRFAAPRSGLDPDKDQSTSPKAE